MNKELIKKNKSLRKNRPLTPDNILYSTFESQNLFQICFKSKGCKNYLAGLCIMCDYGLGRNITLQELNVAFDKAILEAKTPIKMLLLNTYGSILDEDEFSNECLELLLNKISETKINIIIFETHYTTITKEKLNLIKSKLVDKNVYFEFGFETSNSKIREEYLLKLINNKEFEETIKLVHSLKMGVMVNLLVGVPFLTPKEQINDVLNSIEWLSKNNADEIDLFPINIKPYTLLNELYKNNEYDVISQWLLIEILNRVNEKDISNIYLSWYGNRKLNYGENMDTIFPKTCEKCNDKIFAFYDKFLSNSNSNFRKKLITDLFSSIDCNCYKEMLNSLNDTQ